jgi:hypothetical protein
MVISGISFEIDTMHADKNFLQDFSRHFWSEFMPKMHWVDYKGVQAVLVADTDENAKITF